MMNHEDTTEQVCHLHSSQREMWKSLMTSDLRVGWTKVSFVCVYMRQMLYAEMKDEGNGALCWWNMRWQQDGNQMGEDQDSTLVFCESTSCMLMTSVLTPLSYTGLSNADSSVMLSYGGKDVGILIDFPCSLSGAKTKGKSPVKGCFHRKKCK